MSNLLSSSSGGHLALSTASLVETSNENTCTAEQQNLTKLEQNEQVLDCPVTINNNNTTLLAPTTKTSLLIKQKAIQTSGTSSNSNSSSNIVVNLNSNQRTTNSVIAPPTPDPAHTYANNLSNNKYMATDVANTLYSSSSRSSIASPALISKSRREEFHIFYQKCMRGISHSINIIKAVMMRLVFSLHSLIAIVFVYWVKEDEWYLVNLVGVVFLQMELFITIIRRKGREPRW